MQRIMFKRAFVERLVPAFYYWYQVNRFYLQDEDLNVLYSKGKEFGRRFVLMTKREQERYIERMQEEFMSIEYNPNLDNNFLLNDEEINFLDLL